MDTSRTQVALADADVLQREGLASLIERSGWSHRPGRRCRRAHGLVVRLRPDLAVVDIRMPPKHSTEGLKRPG